MIKTYRRKGTLKAEQFLPNEGQIPVGVCKFSDIEPIQYVVWNGSGTFDYLVDGDYVVTQEDGYKYRVLKHVFDDNYELVD